MALPLLKAFLLPPGCVLVIAALGLAVRRFRPRVGVTLLVASWVLLATLSMPACSGWLAGTLEHAPPLDPRGSLPEVGAIVVLSGDVYSAAPEYGGDTVGPLTLMRLRYGAWLHRKTGAPLLVTGGRLQPEYRPLGDMMAEILRDELGVPVRWVESESRNTAANARRSAKLLREAGVTRILLVTSATHIPRAREVFAAEGLDVVPAPTGVTKADPVTPGDFLPRSGALVESTLALHEWIGRAWYWIRW
jgi:uncharacterized SAM-binding protein YcdF (DUF218 family)